MLPVEGYYPINAEPTQICDATLIPLQYLYLSAFKSRFFILKFKSTYLY